MPIYEFYCEPCNTVFQFFSRRINTSGRPACPGCGRKNLKREASSFSTSGRGSKTDDGKGGPAGLDDSAVESALETMAKEAETVNDNDPRQAARLMRRFSDMSGMPLGGTMEEALSRMESGEDPESIERELGDSLGAEDPFAQGEKKAGGSPKKARPLRDAKIYPM